MTRISALRFWREQDGAALVEFGILLPVFLLFLAVSFEGGRTFWAYQTTISGVRDATRYLSRVVPRDICDTNGNTAVWNDKLAEIVRDTMGGGTLFPASISIEGVTSTVVCTMGDFRGGNAPVATITAQLRIEYPFAGVVRMTGGSLEAVTTSVSDQARILGS